MAFDVLRFVQDFNIPYITEGANTSSSFEVNVNCPYCNDSGFHMGISSKNGVHHCWRCGTLNTKETIRILTGVDNVKPILKKYGVLSSGPIEKKRTEYKLPDRELVVPGTKDFKKAHKRYLEKRGFDPDYLIRKYDLRVTGSIGKLNNRIIVPIKFQNRIVSYQGRTYIKDDSIPKYITCHPDDELIHHKSIFFNLENATGDSVIIVEGVFDALKLGPDNVIASFGTSITPSQLNLIKERYKKVFMFYDAEEAAQNKAMKALYTLNSFGIETENLLLDEGDPGDLDITQALQLKGELHLL